MGGGGGGGGGGVYKSHFPAYCFPKIPVPVLLLFVCDSQSQRPKSHFPVKICPADLNKRSIAGVASLVLLQKLWVAFAKYLPTGLLD